MINNDLAVGPLSPTFSFIVGSSTDHAGLELETTAATKDAFIRLIPKTLSDAGGWWQIDVDESDAQLWRLRVNDGTNPTVEAICVETDGRVGLSTLTPATSALLDLTSTTGALLLSRMTTTQRNALTAVNGMVIYNTTTNAFNFYENGAWVSGSGLA